MIGSTLLESFIMTVLGGVGLNKWHLREFLEELT
jgi:hypothetical protein